MTDQTPQIRPMGLGDILDGAFKIYRARFAAMFLSALLPYLPMLFSGTLLALALGSGSDGATLAGAGAMLISVPLMLVGFVLSYGSLTHIVSEAYQGRMADLGDGMRKAVSRALPLSGAIILAAAAVMVGFVLCVVPGVIVGLMFFAVVPAVVLEGRGPVDALGRSRDLSQNALGPIFLVMFVAGLIAALPSYALSMATYAAGLTGETAPGMQMAAMLLRLLLGALTTPLSSAATVLLYYDRRIRTEAYDVQVAAERLAAQPGS
jgi:hypothetical protein